MSSTRQENYKLHLLQRWSCEEPIQRPTAVFAAKYWKNWKNRMFNLIQLTSSWKASGIISLNMPAETQMRAISLRSRRFWGVRSMKKSSDVMHKKTKRTRTLDCSIKATARVWEPRWRPSKIWHYSGKSLQSCDNRRCHHPCRLIVNRCMVKRQSCGSSGVSETLNSILCG